MLWELSNNTIKPGQFLVKPSNYLMTQISQETVVRT